MHIVYLTSYERDPNGVLWYVRKFLIYDYVAKHNKAYTRRYISILNLVNVRCKEYLATIAFPHENISLCDYNLIIFK